MAWIEGGTTSLCVYALKIRHEEPYFDNQTPLCKERTARRNDVYSTHTRGLQPNRYADDCGPKNALRSV